MNPPKPRAFETTAQLDAWLKQHHASEPELWIRMFKKGSGKPSVDWNECVATVIAWGWIDGVRRAYDELSFVQRFTPRRSRSSWSKRNCDIAERLIAEGRMQPAGMAHVLAAKADGRWERAYAGSADMELPSDFLQRLQKNAAAKRFFATLSRANQFAVYHRLHSAKRPETRERRLVDIIARLERGEKWH